MEYPKTPMLDRIQEVKGESQKLGAFLDWLQSSGRVLCRWSQSDHWDENGPDGYYQTSESIERILAEYFGIDLYQAERERDSILEYLRSQD